MWSLEFGILSALCVGHVIFHAGAFASRAAAKVSEPRRPGAEVEDLGPYVERRLRKKRHEAWLGLCAFLEHVAGIGASWAVTNVLLYGKSNGYVRNHIAYYLLMSLCCALFRHLPGQRALSQTWDRCDVAYAVFMLSTTFRGMTGGCFMDQQMGLVRMAFSAVHRSSRQCAAWNLLYTTCVFFRVPIARAIARALGRPHEVEPCWHPLWTLDTLWDPLFSLCVVVGITVIFEELSKQEADSTILAQSRSNEHKALTSILNATSDAVVRLDARLNIVGPTQKLSAMLCHWSASLDGVSFASLVQPGSSDLPWISERPSEIGDSLFAARIQTEMRDSTGGPIKIVGFHTQFTELDGSTGHLLGLSEAVDHEEPRAVAPILSFDQAKPVNSADSTTSLRPSSEPGALSAGSGSGSDASSSSSGVSERVPLAQGMPSSGGDSEAGLPVIWLNTHHGFGMALCTRSFLLIGGPNLPLDTHLLDWAGRNSDIAMGVQEFLDEQAAFDERPGGGEQDFVYETSVRMFPRHLGRNYMVVARATMVMESLKADDDPSPSGVKSTIRIAFRDVDFRQRTESEMSSRPGSGSLRDICEDGAVAASEAPPATRRPAIGSLASRDVVAL